MGESRYLIRVRFYQSRSRLLKRAISLAKSFPTFEDREGLFFCAIDNIYDYCRLQLSAYELIQIIEKWKDSEIWLYDTQYKNRADYHDFLTVLKGSAGKYTQLINESNSRVSLGQISIEDLPYPIVYYPEHYGAFFGFSMDIGSPICFCECERLAIDNYIKLRKRTPISGFTNDKSNPLGSDMFPITVSRISKGHSDPLSLFEFKEGICFRCNKKVPNYTYCHPMYGGAFKQHYGWYIQQEYYKLGIDKNQHKELSVLEDTCDPDIYDSLNRLFELHKMAYSNLNIDETREQSEIRSKIDRVIENSVRTQLGFRKIGDIWISETILYEIVCQIFEGSEVKRHYRPSWLEGLELDIFVPAYNIAFEYQGIQHFQAVKHWGGEQQLKKQRDNDARKKRICLERNIHLICINYYDPLTTEYVVKCINSRE